MALADKIRAAREKWIKAGGFEFQIRRPTDYDLARMARESQKLGVEGIADEMLINAVCGWKIQEKLGLRPNRRRRPRLQDDQL